MASAEPVVGYTGYVKNGVVVVEDADDALVEGVRVRVQLVEPARQSLAEQFQNFIGKAKGLPADFADNHDHYIHGAPKNE